MFYSSFFLCKEQKKLIEVKNYFKKLKKDCCKNIGITEPKSKTDTHSSNMITISPKLFVEKERKRREGGE